MDKFLLYVFCGVFWNFLIIVCICLIFSKMEKSPLKVVIFTRCLYFRKKWMSSGKNIKNVREQKNPNKKMFFPRFFSKVEKSPLKAVIFTRCLYFRKKMWSSGKKEKMFKKNIKNRGFFLKWRNPHFKWRNLHFDFLKKRFHLFF